jgi:hypothetical protein
VSTSGEKGPVRTRSSPQRGPTPPDSL